MVEKQIPINQTQFSFEEPIFENQAVYAEEKPEDTKPQSKKKLFVVFGVIGFFVLLLLLIIVVRMSRNGQIEEIIDEPDTQVSQELGPLEQRIKDARELLNLADPAKQDLAFPPIDMDLRLDPKER